MALTGVATAFAYLCFENKRWLWLAAIGAAFGVAGALLGVPMLNRLTQRIDPQWLELLHNRDTLFVTQWPATVWWSKIVEASTVAIAIHLTMNPVRRLLIAILTVSSAGLALSAIFGDLFSLLLIVQAQPWRVTWLLAAGAAMSFAISAEPLWKGGWPSRLTLALLVCAWAMDGTDVGALLAVASWLLSVSGSRIEPRISESAIRLLCLAAAALVTAKIGADFYHVATYASRLPADAQPPLVLRLLDAHVFSEIAAILIVAFVAVPHFRVGVTVASIRNVAICVFAIWFWREEWDPLSIADHAFRRAEGSHADLGLAPGFNPVARGQSGNLVLGEAAQLGRAHSVQRNCFFSRPDRALVRKNAGATRSRLGCGCRNSPIATDKA